MSANDQCENNANTGQNKKDVRVRQSDNTERPLSYRMVADCLLSLKAQICRDESITRNIDDLKDVLDMAIDEFSGKTMARLPMITVTGSGDEQSPLTDEQTDKNHDDGNSTHGRTETINESIDRCQTAVNFDPLNYHAYFNLGFFLRAAGRYKEAVEAFMSFLTFANTDDAYDLKMVHQALKWLRYIDRKMELFGHCRTLKETAP